MDYVKILECCVTNYSILDTWKHSFICDIPDEVKILENLIHGGSHGGHTTDEGTRVYYHSEELLDLSGYGWFGHGVYTSPFCGSKWTL